MGATGEMMGAGADTDGSRPHIPAVYMYLPGALPCGSSQVLGINTPRQAELQVEGGNVGPNAALRHL